MTRQLEKDIIPGENLPLGIQGKQIVSLLMIFMLDCGKA